MTWVGFVFHGVFSGADFDRQKGSTKVFWKRDFLSSGVPGKKNLDLVH